MYVDSLTFLMVFLFFSSIFPILFLFFPIFSYFFLFFLSNPPSSRCFCFPVRPRGLSALEVLESSTLRSSVAQQRLLEMEGLEVLLGTMRPEVFFFCCFRPEGFGGFFVLVCVFANMRPIFCFGEMVWGDFLGGERCCVVFLDVFT